MLSFTGSSANYLEKKKIDVVFSLSSLSVAYTCFNLNLPLIIFFEDLHYKLNDLIWAYEKVFFIVPENLNNQTLILKWVDLKKTRRCKPLQKGSDILFQKAIESIADNIEYLKMVGKSLPIQVLA